MLPPLILTLLAGCASDTVVTAEPLCKAGVKPVCVSSADHLTAKTASNILQTNEGLRAACGRLPKCPREAAPTGAPPPAASPVKPPANPAMVEPSTS
jgi:hypothetical protein